ncbi:hypothetical protein B4U80_11450, partial [Leptotrombidium deliense]
YTRECFWTECLGSYGCSVGFIPCYPHTDFDQVKYENCASGGSISKIRKLIHTYYLLHSVFITFDEFVKAVAIHGYPSPGCDKYNALTSQAHSAGNISSKQELAMFLTQILYTSGGLVVKSEIRCKETGCHGEYDSSVGAHGKSYYGRGYIQLSHSYNYRQASQDLYGDLRLIENPDLVSDDENVAWATALWYWKTRVRNQPNVLNFWFGATTNAIIGALECRGGYQHLARKRFDMYKMVLLALNIHAKPNERGCYN